MLKWAAQGCSVQRSCRKRARRYTRSMIRLGNSARFSPHEIEEFRQVGLDTSDERRFVPMADGQVRWCELAFLLTTQRKRYDQRAGALSSSSQNSRIATGRTRAQKPACATFKSDRTLQMLVADLVAREARRAQSRMLSASACCMTDATTTLTLTAGDMGNIFAEIAGTPSQGMPPSRGSTSEVRAYK
jgi:hypothetical protein